MTLFSAQHFSYLEMRDCRQLAEFTGRLPSFIAAYIKPACILWGILFCNVLYQEEYPNVPFSS